MKTDPVALVRVAATELARRQMLLTTRQIATLLICYQESERQTVRGLALQIQCQKQAITHALDKLAEIDLLKRMLDPADRRSVLVLRTPKGTALVGELKKIMRDAIESAEQAAVVLEHVA